MSDIPLHVGSDGSASTWECKEPGCVVVRHVDPNGSGRVYATHVHPSEDTLIGFELVAALDGSGEVIAALVNQCETPGCEEEAFYMGLCAEHANEEFPDDRPRH